MLANQGYAAYANNKIMTASPAELTLMLYEGAIKFANLAIVGIEEKDIMKAHTNIMKVEHIIEEFQSTLDHKYPVAKDFDEVYSYLMIRLREANMKKDKEILEEVLKHLRTLQSLQKKEKILNSIIQINKRQKEELENPSLDPDDFDKTVEEKSELIEQLELLDYGFEKLYEKVREELQTNKELYKEEILQMQNSIRALTEKSMEIQTQCEKAGKRNPFQPESCESILQEYDEEGLCGTTFS